MDCFNPRCEREPCGSEVHGNSREQRLASHGRLAASHSGTSPDHLFDYCSITVRLLFDYCSIIVRLLFDYCSIIVRLLFDYCSIIVSLLFAATRPGNRGEGRGGTFRSSTAMHKAKWSSVQWCPLPYHWVVAPICQNRKYRYTSKKCLYY